MRYGMAAAVVGQGDLACHGFPPEGMTVLEDAVAARLRVGCGWTADAAASVAVMRALVPHIPATARDRSTALGDDGMLVRLVAAANDLYPQAEVLVWFDRAINDLRKEQRCPQETFVSTPISYSGSLMDGTQRSTVWPSTCLMSPSPCGPPVLP
jgi:hypothetical protein